MDITFVKGPEYTRRWNVQDRTNSSLSETIKAGQPLKKNGQYATLIEGGDPEVGTDQMIGVANAESTESSSDDGHVDVRVVVPQETVLRGPADTAGNLSDSILGNSVTFDVDSGTFKIDEDETDDPDVHGLVIEDYDADQGTVDVVVKPEATHYGASIT